MIKRTDYHRKGSVIVMVVGLLVMLAMIGTTFIIIANMDRRESRSIATVAPMKQVADGMLQQIRVKLGKDLYISSGNVIYGDAADYKEQCDFAHEGCDRHLAVFGPVDMGGILKWRHITNIHGADAGDVENVAANGLADTDGYCYEYPVGSGNWYSGDAVLFKSGVGNRSGQNYWVAVRIIDASSLMNVNSAYSSITDAAAAAGEVMPVTNIALDVLTGTGVRDSVHDARNGSTADNIATYNTNYVQRPLNPLFNTYLPFDASDMTALRWGGAVPDTASGRLFEALGVQFDVAKSYQTVHSASRNYIRRAGGILDTTRRVNLNSAAATAVVFVDLFNAFYNAIPAGITGFTDNDTDRRTVAAQLAVNVIDYRDADDTPYQPTGTEMTAVGLTGVTLFGIERQPFITEAWLRMEWDASVPPGSVKQKSAIELFNPYATAISLTGYKLKVGTGTANDFQNLPVPPEIPAGGRIVIVSSAAEIRAMNKYQDTNLDLMKTCTIFRPTSVLGSYAPVGSVDVGEFGLTEPSVVLPAAVHARIRRDDDTGRAKYSVAVYTPPENYTYKIGDGGCPDPDDTNLGRSNSDVDLGAAVAPTPVFVRNGSLINLGEVSRIFYVGPTSSDVPLDNVLESMSPTNVSNGRLYTLGAIKVGTHPQIPPICMLGDYMDVLTPDPNNTGRTDTVYGRININIAPWQVIQCLPGISAMTTQVGIEPVTSRPILMRERVARDIVAYRDLLDNSAVHIGGHDYSTAGTPRFTVTNLNDLREDAGFASPGEIAIPLAKIVTLPNNTYSPSDSAPNCYKVADSGVSDDGLNEITGDLSKHDIYYSWLSNQITVRSDVYIVYIRVQIDDNPATTGAVRKYVAVIDRSNCTSPNDLPDVLMFAELK